MADCKGKCYGKQWKIKPNSLKLNNSGSVRILPREGETAQQARERCVSVDYPDDAEKMAALQRSVRQNFAEIEEKCTGDYCDCVFPAWGPYLPEDVTEGENAGERWLEISVAGHFERGGCKFEFWGHLKAKVRERTGTCYKKAVWPKTAYVPEWGIDLEADALAALSDESLALLKEKFG